LNQNLYVAIVVDDIIMKVQRVTNLTKGIQYLNTNNRPKRNYSTVKPCENVLKNSDKSKQETALNRQMMIPKHRAVSSCWNYCRLFQGRVKKYLILNIF